MKKLFLFLVTVLLLPAMSAMSQDNPNLDQIPKELRNRPILNSPYSPNAILTDNQGYDNFYMGVAFSEPHISAHPRNLTQFFTAFNTNATYYTLNGGLDWFTNNPVFPSYSAAGDPVTAYDSLGNLYYMNMAESGSSIIGCFTFKSTNNGVSWLPGVWSINGVDKNWIACDQTSGPYANFVYCTMTAGSGFGAFSRSTDFGASYQTTFQPNTQSLPGMMVAVGPYKEGSTDVPGGCVYVVTNSGSSFSAYYTFYMSTNGGASFVQMSTQQFPNYVGTNVGGRNSVQNMRTRPYPFITADNSYGPRRGRLYLVYSSNNPAGNGNKPDIYCRYSTDRGTSWSSPVTINDDPNSTGNHQWHPSIWSDKETGRLYVKWFDTRNCPTSDSAEVYASYSDDGGLTFVQNQKIGTSKFKIDCSSCGGGGTPRYLGDYDAIISNSKTSMLVWSDFRNGAFGSYTAYYPDFAMTTDKSSMNVLNNDSGFVTVKIPSVKSYNDKVKFSLALDTNPTSGSIQLSFVGKDSIMAYPDSVRVRVKVIGTVPTKTYRLLIVGRGSNGTPVHRREVAILANLAQLTVGSNRTGITTIKVNGVGYTSRTTLTFPIGTSVTVQAVSPYVSGGTRYTFVNWSNNGDTTQTFNINSNLDLLATYKAQYRLVIVSSQGNTFGGNIYYDSAAPFTFGVTTRTVVNMGITYYFRGWTGAGNGAYTSPDSTGNDSAVTVSISNPIVETVRWSTTVGINSLGTEIPEVFKLYSNYPNPFNPETVIRFDVPKAAYIELKVYDLLGREVAVLVNKELKAGKYEYKFDGSGLKSGIYFYRFNSAEYTEVKRMVLVK